MKKINKKLNVIVADVCYDDNGLSTPVIPLGAGLVAAHAKAVNPDILVSVYKGITPLIDEIKKNPPDVIGLTNYVWNNNLAIRIANVAKKINPDVLIVFGGPEIDKSPANKSIMNGKYNIADFFIQYEGELAFANLIKRYLELGLDKSKLKNEILKLGNCFIIENKKIIAGPNLHRIEDLDLTPSPYTTGLLDKFLEDPAYMPMIQTNRGCPFSCTFCQEGEEYFNKVRRKSLSFVKTELDYIAKKVRPEAGLWITDSNWAMYKWDEDIADHIASIQKKISWPRELITSTGKSQLERIIKIANKLNNAMFISNSIQSMNPDVLKEIKRKNLPPAELEKNKESLKSIRQEPEIIVPLPNETKKTFFEGINTLLDNGKNQRFAVFQCLILTNTEMANTNTISKFGLNIKYKQHWNLFGWVENEFVCETERVTVATNTMSEEDYLSCRSYAMVLDSILRFEPIHEVFKLLENYNIKNSIFTSALFNKMENKSNKLQQCIRKFKDNLKAETHNSEEEVIKYMKENEDKYKQGVLGGGNLKYSNMLWVDHFEENLEAIFQTLKEVLINKEDSVEVVNNLEKYLRFVYFDRLNKEVPDIVSNYFDYDLLKWSKNKSNTRLQDYKNKIEYKFKKTSLSNIDTKQIWANFGFIQKEEEEKSQDNESKEAVGWDNRFFISKLRREVTF
jgi:radical SAM superfamily enzyme YgiQ (UPF0313 family)